jgi:hypothetical protein
MFAKIAYRSQNAGTKKAVFAVIPFVQKIRLVTTANALTGIYAI